MLGNVSPDEFERAKRIGLLAPFAELPGEYVDVLDEASEPVVVWQVVTESIDSHDIPHLRALGSDEALRSGAQRLKRWRPDFVMWACTSGSFVFGREGAIRQAAMLEAAAGVAASSTSLAFVDALRSLSISIVSVLSPYPAEATDAFIAYLGEYRVSVAKVLHLDHPGARSSELLDGAATHAALTEFDPKHVILLPDTAVWGFEILESLAGAPYRLLVANQVTLWQAFRRLSISTDTPRFGILRSATLGRSNGGGTE